MTERADSSYEHAEWPQKLDVFGTGVSATSLHEMMHLFAQRHADHAITVNVCNVHSVMSARSDDRLATAFESSEINTPDGMPLVWVMRSLGLARQDRVKGAELAKMAFEFGIERGWRHFFYGSTPETLDRLTTTLAHGFPGLQISGAVSPPFRPPTAAELDTIAADILASRTDIVWVGLGMPKQEMWMHEMRSRLPGTVLVGIGAAFDFIAGTKPEAPRWMQQAGLEWAFRLSSEPRRLWRRYAWNNPAFLVLWLREILLKRTSER